MSPTAPQTTAAQTMPGAPHQALYRRWRAQRFSEIVGQTAVVETLRNAVRSERVAHAILFVGPRGTGKTSLARILAKALNCTNLQDGDPCDACEACVAIREGRALDLVEIDAASNRGIDAIRDLRERIHYAPTDLRRKVYILDEAHQITKDAWNALLKSLEEPPEFVAFMFASTHPQEFPPAILSRLQRYDVRRLSLEEIEGKLRRILEAEGVSAEPGAVHLIARLAAGGMRDAESILDQVLASAAGGIDEATVRELLGLAEAEAIETLTAALVEGDPGHGLRILAELDERGRDVAVVLDQIVEQVRTELSAAIGPDGDPVRAARLAATARRLAAIDPERRGAGGLRFQLELVLIESAAMPSPGGTTRTAVSAVRPGPVALPPAPEPASAERIPEPTPRPARGPAPTVASQPAATHADEPPRGPNTTPDPAEPVPAATSGPAAAADDPRPAAPRPATGGDLDRLVAGWASIVGSVRPATRAVITECRPIGVEGNVVTLGFPEAKAFLKDVADRKRGDLEAAVGDFLGHAVAVRCVATNVEIVPLTANGDAADLISEARRIFAEDLVDVGEVS